MTLFHSVKTSLFLCLLLGACVPGPGYNSGYDNGYSDQRRPSSYQARPQGRDHAIREAQEQHDQRVRQLQHEFDKHQISERALRDGIKQADHDLSREIANLR